MFQRPIWPTPKTCFWRFLSIPVVCWVCLVPLWLFWIFASTPRNDGGTIVLSWACVQQIVSLRQRCCCSRSWHRRIKMNALPRSGIIPLVNSWALVWFWEPPVISIVACWRFTVRFFGAAMFRCLLAVRHYTFYIPFSLCILHFVQIWQPLFTVGPKRNSQNWNRICMGLLLVFPWFVLRLESFSNGTGKQVCAPFVS